LRNSTVLSPKTLPSSPLSNKIRNSSGRAGLLWLWQSFLKDNVDAKRSVLVAQRHY